VTNGAKIGAAGTSPFNLGPRLRVTFAILILLILGGNALVVWQFDIIRNETEHLTGANRQLVAVLRLQANLLSFHRGLDDLARSMDLRRLVTEAESMRGALHEQTQQTRTAIANLPSETVVDPSFLPTLDTIDITLSAQIDAILDLAKSGDWGAIQPRISNELNSIETQTAILVNNINQQASGELARGVAGMRSVQRRILMIVPATALSTFFIAAFFGWSIARRFVELSLDERVAERTRIARELHDTLLQSFHALMFQFQAARNQLPERPENDKGLRALDDAIATTEEAIAEGRDAIHDLRPGPSAKSDLAHLLTTAGRELAGSQDTNGNSTSFRVIVEGEPQALSPMLQDEIYRIAREVIRNAFRHADASLIEAEIRYDQRQLRLRIRDDGKGIEPKVLEGRARTGHWGLAGIRERAQRIGAKVDFWSEARAGTEVELTVPAKIAYKAERNDSRFRLSRKAGSDE